MGLPRSGTTWTASILACARGAVAVMEPDNEKESAAAVGAKYGLGRFPVLAPGEDAERYRALWAWAMAGAPPGVGRSIGGRVFRAAGPDEREALASGHASARLRLAGRLARPRPGRVPPGTDGGRVVVKTVHACLAAEWVADACDAEVVVVLRHPANVLASWLELDMPDADRRLDRNPAVQARYVERWGLAAPGPEPVARAVWQLGLLTAALEEAAGRHPRWHVRVHEDLCADPAAEFRRLYDDLGLEWNDRAETTLREGDRPGGGFDLHRQASQAADAWRARLGADDVATLHAVLASFPLQHWSFGDAARPAP
jgi:hypothetical protein